MRTRQRLHFLLSLTAILLLMRDTRVVQGFDILPLTKGAPQRSLGLDVPIIHVPGDVANLQNAINQIPDGGVIELAAGTYLSPNGGFSIINKQKGFTIRAAAGASVVLDGAGSRDILRFVNTDPSRGRPVVFEGLTFANGMSSSAGIAGGITMVSAQATFVGCEFINNRGVNGDNSAGGIAVAFESRAFFFDCLWSGNTSQTYGGGLAIGGHSQVYIHGSQFINNRTNLPGHAPTSSGGAINIGNSTLRVSNSYFEGNQAGYVGGAMYIMGTWTDPSEVPQSDVIVVNSDFIDNRATRDPGVSFHSPTEGGAFHAENQTVARIYNSRFIANEAMIGGGVNLYRAKVNIAGSVLRGNRATDTVFQSGFGGAISVNSADGPDDGTNNRAVSELTVEDTFIQGRYESVTTVAQTGGCLFAGGDGNRVDGDPSVPDMGTMSENRAPVQLRRVAFLDCDVTAAPPNSGVGGGLTVALVDLLIEDSIIASSDAFGVYASGGGMAVIFSSLANVRRTSIANNSADQFGGGIFIQGSEIHITDSQLIENTVGSLNYGSAIFAGPDDSRNLPVTGFVQNNTISNNTGLPVFDDDRTSGPINDIRYDNNRFFHHTVDAPVYTDSLPNYGWKSVDELNSLVIVRANGISTPKSQLPNTALGSEPPTGAIQSAPPHILQIEMSGSSPTVSPARLAYTWSGGTAYLDGQPLPAGNAGAQTTLETGTHTISVAGQETSVEVYEAAIPSAFFTASEDQTGLTLSWSVLPGTFLDAAIDQGVTITPAPVGSIQVSPSAGRVYHFYSITEEGGVVQTVDTALPALYAPASTLAVVGLNLPNHFGYLTIMNVGGSVMDWSAQSSTPDLIQIETPSGQTGHTDTLVFSILVDGRQPGMYQGFIDIDAGDAGNQTVLVTVHVVEILQQSYLPLTH